MTKNKDMEVKILLIRFAVQNFMSYRDMTELRMSAGNSLLHEEHVINERGKRLLKGAFLFGPNASGKSNLIKAASFAQEIILYGIKSVSCEKKYFRIDNKYKSQPGVFQFDIASGGYFYSYGFALSYSDAAVQEEWLYRLDDGLCVFERQKNGNGGCSVKTDLVFSDEKKRARFDVYIQDIESPKMSQTLFLSDVEMRSPDVEEEYQPFRDVMMWFRYLTIIFPETRYGGILRMVEDSNASADLDLLLKYFDTGIDSVGSQHMTFDEVMRNEPGLERLKPELERELRNNYSAAVLTSYPGNRLLEVSYRDGSLYADEVITNHGNKEEMFSFQDESDGTRRLFDILPLYQFGQAGRVILVDELDRSLHSAATREFIRLFYERTENTPSQLIVTTHDLNIMDIEFLRRDEIWFVDRGRENNSVLYSLNKFEEIRHGMTNEDYLLGRFGAVPKFSTGEA